MGGTVYPAAPPVVIVGIPNIDDHVLVLDVIYNCVATGDVNITVNIILSFPSNSYATASFTWLKHCTLDRTSAESPTSVSTSGPTTKRTSAPTVTKSCTDDLTWRDDAQTLYGGDAQLDTSCARIVRERLTLGRALCYRHGAHSLEVRRACPEACGVCNPAAMTTVSPTHLPTAIPCLDNKHSGVLSLLCSEISECQCQDGTPYSTNGVIHFRLSANGETVQRNCPKTCGKCPTNEAAPGGDGEHSR